MTYGVEKRFKFSIYNLVKHHPASRQSITVLFKKMHECGVMVIEKSYGTKEPHSYFFTHTAMKYINSDKLLLKIWQDKRSGFIPILNGSYKTSSKDTEVKSITNSNRFFLLILMLHSDSLGSVDRLSLKELALLTGLNKGGVQYQIKSLIKAGLIYSHIQGVHHKKIFNKEKSVLMLDVMHPFINYFYPKTSRFILDVSGIIDTEYLGASESLSVMLRLPSIHHNMFNKIVDGNSIKRIISKEDIRLHHQLQTLICETASNILNLSWDNQVEKIDKFISEALNINLEWVTQKDADEFIKLIRLWSVKQVEVYNLLLKCIYGSCFKYEKISIVPFQKSISRVLKFEVLFEERYGRYGKNNDIFKVDDTRNIVDINGNFLKHDFSEFLNKIVFIYLDNKE